MVRQSLTRGYRIALVALAGMAAAFTFTVTPAQAEIDYPVCMRVYGGGVGGLPSYDDCSFTSIAQCNMTASGLPAQCLENPFYGMRGTPVTELPRRHHRHRRAR